MSNIVVIETLTNDTLAQHIHTPPSELVLGDPAVCIDDDNVTNCGTYYVNNIMLGQEIIIDACVRDYYNQPTVETQFVVDSNDENHFINGSNSVLISCTNGLQGICITGSKFSDIVIPRYEGDIIVITRVRGGAEDECNNNEYTGYNCFISQCAGVRRSLRVVN